MDAQTQIVNKALILIGAQRILSMADAGNEAQTAAELWDSVRDAVMRAYPWNCCVRQATLAALSSTPAFGYSYQYQLPQDPLCLRVLGMQYHDSIFRIQGRYLLTDESTCSITYIARETDITIWDPLLKEAVAARLASELAYPLSNSATLAKTRWDLYREILAEARSIDAQEGTPEQYEVTAWLDARK